jgi:diguanylate cyclase (GGDEF)-like protein
MHLDMLTMSAVDITVTAIIGAVLVLNGAPERGTSFVSWWGLAMLLQSLGVVIAAVSSFRNAGDAATIGTATMILADALKWKASREFAHRRVGAFWIVIAPIGFLLATHSGYVESLDGRLILLVTVMAIFNLAAAIELANANGERLASRWPAVILLVVTSVSFVSWLPLSMLVPIHEAKAIFTSDWFPEIVLVSVLLRIALAFIVLSMAKERQELEQRVDALTDSLTGLPNRRALFEAADALGQNRDFKGDAVSVLLFDLDHFKETNDRFGHAFGDRVLKLFATTASGKLNGGSIVARLGGEEFAAILPGADPLEAAGAAEAVRRAFAKSAAFVDGLPVGATVSVGAASVAEIDGDLNALFRRADAALYMAKRAGRNRVELLGLEEGSPLAEVEVVRSSIRKPFAPLTGPRPFKLRA